MKNIAIVIYELTIEYHITVVNGIINYFQDKPDVNVIIAPVNVPCAITSDYDYQYWTVSEVLRSKSIDAYIIVTNTFSGYCPISRMEQEFRKYSDRPVISVAVPLNIPNSSYTCNVSKPAFENIVHHLVNVHDRHNIAFFSAELNRSLESDERLKSYKAALAANNLEFREKWVFPGDFTPATTHKYFLDNYKSAVDVDFDALICCNDYMAAAAIGALSDLGLKVPEDVCVIGYDDSDVSTSCNPTISTVDQQIELSGYKAGEMAYKAACGKEIPHKRLIQSTPIYRQSCGCISCREHTDSYIDQYGLYHEQEKTSGNQLNLFGNALNDLSNIYHMLNSSESISDLNDYFSTLVKTLRKLYFRKTVFCLYDKVYDLSPEDEFTLPQSARMMLYFDGKKDVEKNYYSDNGVRFNPHHTILPLEEADLEGGVYIMLPISLRNMNYGYVLSSIPENRYTVNSVFLKIMANGFIHAYEYSKKMNQNTKLEALNQELSVQSRTDDLTKLFNRRGFMEYAQRMLDLSIVTGAKGSVFFFDLDGLKNINDTWGHKMGDQAIQTCGDVLRDTFHKSDIIGRLSGDEFAVVAPGFEKQNEDLLRIRLQTLCSTYSKKRNLPFTLSVSLGICEYSNEYNVLTDLLIQADRELYKEKKIKHSMRK